MKINTDPVFGFSYIQNPNHAFNFALLKGNRVLHTPFECKDYINDIFWSQETGNEGHLWGIKTTKNMMNIKVRRFDLALIGGVSDNLRKWIPYLQEFLNVFEDAQNIKHSIVTETEEDGTIVVNFDKDWTKNGPLLSTFTTLIRIAGAYKGGDVVKYLLSLRDMKKSHNIHPEFMEPEVVRLYRLLPRLNAVLQGKEIIHSWDDIENIEKAHETGILGWKDFPEVEI